MKFLSLITILFPMILSAQLTAVKAELYYQDDGTIPGYPEGYSTYRIYAELPDTNTCITSVFAYNCNKLLISAEDDIWQHPMGTNTGADINAKIIELEPALEYDSFVTIGRANNQDGKGSVFIAAAEKDSSFFNFALGKDLILLDGAWASLKTERNGYGKKVLLAQITTSKKLSYALNLQVIDPEGVSHMFTAYDYDEDCNVLSSASGSALGLLKE